MKLETKRLILRTPTMKDAKDIAEGLNNLEVERWLLRTPYPYKKKDAEWWIKKQREKKKGKQDSYGFVIELKSEKKIIGGASLENVDQFNGKAGGGIWLNAKYHSKGYGPEAWGEILNFAFNKLKLRKMENGFLKGNPSSFKMQKKFGYKIEGMRRKTAVCKADGKVKDEYITGLLKEEWKKNQNI